MSILQLLSELCYLSSGCLETNTNLSNFQLKGERGEIEREGEREEERGRGEGGARGLT